MIVEDYGKFLRLRGILQSIKQFSWRITRLDQTFPAEKLTDDQIPQIIAQYEALIAELKTILG